MANPSLQIGNSNWAIKEDNLLGYSTAGTRFVPQPITMIRASAGTRVNSSGLVETVELLGSEEVTCGNFECASPESVWSTGTGWSFEGGIASCDGTQVGTTSLIQSSVFTSGIFYKITFDLTVSAGALSLWINGTQLVQNSITSTESKSYYVEATATGSIYFEGNVDFSGTINNVSVKESTKNNLARVDYDGTASSLLVEPERRNLYSYSNDTTTWSESNFTATNNYAISPDGTQNAFRGVSTSNASLLYISSTGSAGTNTISIYAKSNTDSDQKFRFFGNGNTTQSTDQTATQEWQRFEYTETYSFITWGLLGASVSGTNDILFYGMQHEVGSYPTSLIPTDGGTVTRIQDQYSKTGISNLINSEEGVLFLEMAALSDDTSSIIISINDGSLSNSVAIYYYSNVNNVASNIFNGGSNPSLIGTIPNSGTRYDFNKIALKYKSGDSALWINGIEVFTLGDSISLTGLNEISFDYGNGSFPFYGKVKQLQVFKTALTDTELIALTT